MARSQPRLLVASASVWLAPTVLVAGGCTSGSGSGGRPPSEVGTAGFRQPEHVQSAGSPLGSVQSALGVQLLVDLLNPLVSASVSIILPSMCCWSMHIVHSHARTCTTIGSIPRASAGGLGLGDSAWARKFLARPMVGMRSLMSPILRWALISAYLRFLQATGNP